jgi:hypothetical protein
LKKGQFFRLDAQAKEWSDKTIKRVHSERISRASHRTRVSNAIRQIRKKGPERSI